ncbi:helix-turn-helix domain-containing protein [Spirosoma sp. SC4-14]|uniref:MarR family transcriptional regulator n=1 Tax=Spirosoma sp. SC4-14 TaxID=3128900 RepID=UPI0030CA8A72
MVLTFGQYRILLATRHCINYTQLIEQTHFDQALVSYLVAGLLDSGLIVSTTESVDESAEYALTDTGLISIEEYERANPDLIMYRAMS